MVLMALCLPGVCLQEVYGYFSRCRLRVNFLINVLPQCGHCLLSKGKADITDIALSTPRCVSPFWSLFTVFGTYTTCCWPSTWPKGVRFLIGRRQVLWVSFRWSSSCKGWPFGSRKDECVECVVASWCRIYQRMYSPTHWRTIPS